MTDRSHAQTQTSTSTTTGVFALLKAKPGVTRERVMAIVPVEIRATIQLYLDGKIRKWYSREDGRGGVFLLNTRDVAETKSIMESLPLAKESMLDHEYIPVGPPDAVASADRQPISHAVTQSPEHSAGMARRHRSRPDLVCAAARVGATAFVKSWRGNPDFAQLSQIWHEV